MRSSDLRNFRRRAAHISAVKSDFRTGGRRTEIALYLLHFLGYGFPHCALHRPNGPGWRGRWWTLPRRCCSRGRLSCNCGRSRRRLGLSVPIYERVQLLPRLALVIYVVHLKALLLSLGVETFPLGQRNAPGPLRVNGAPDTEWRIVAFLHQQRIDQLYGFAVVAVGVEIDLIAIFGNAAVIKGDGASFRIEDRDADVVRDGGVCTKGHEQ